MDINGRDSLVAILRCGPGTITAGTDGVLLVKNPLRWEHPNGASSHRWDVLRWETSHATYDIILTTPKIQKISFSFSLCYLTSNITNLNKTRQMEELIITEWKRSAQSCIMYASARLDLSLVHQTTCVCMPCRSCAASILHVTLTYILHYPPNMELKASHGETMQEREITA